ncbi:MAG: hypothetical protein ACRDPA_27120 [Solirubrobacteraceae bacterium]
MWSQQLTGLLAWLAWLTGHLYYLIGLRNRAVVLVNWAWSHVRKGAHSITRIGPDPLADKLTGTVAEVPPCPSRLTLRLGRASSAVCSRVGRCFRGV